MGNLYVRQFETGVIEHEHAEADLINNTYDNLARIGISHKLLETAIEYVEADLTNPTRPIAELFPKLVVPNGMEFGYQDAKHAYRWLEYRQANLEDLKPIYKSLQDEQLVFAGGTIRFYGDKIDEMVAEQHTIRVAMDAGDPFYFRLFAGLDELRDRAPRTIRKHRSIYEAEKHHALSALLNIFDCHVDGNEGFDLVGDKVSWGDLDLEGQTPMGYMIARKIEPACNIYTFSSNDRSGGRDLPFATNIKFTEFNGTISAQDFRPDKDTNLVEIAHLIKAIDASAELYFERLKA